jgi:hypothetical protein
MKHVRFEHDPCNLPGHCQFCDGGIFECTVCWAVEGQLPTDCPGFELTADQKEDIWEGKVDFKDGKWVLGKVYQSYNPVQRT